MNMNCPHCQNEYQVAYQRITGFTKGIKSAYEIYYQTCPHCDKPIVGMYQHPVPGYEFDFEKRKKLIKFYGEPA
ncbi:protein of unknown function [Candidatus Nitrosocosmicus franklandus]|uniref:Uncharacterized protein n=2 Tax=Candidatus Nitrosocosmicus franklandianus TaxID=1798806 RepID=A0A484IGF0_9ARCH|nr:protein of unknown function [Candidatus Nitrosocosmicus franklandus]